MAAKAKTKSQVLSGLAEATGLSKGDVSGVLDALAGMIGSELNAGNPFNVPGLMKVTTRVKPGRPAGYYKNPFTGEDVYSDARAPQTQVKVRPLKGLKDLVAPPE